MSLAEDVATRFEGSIRLAWQRALAQAQQRVSDYEAINGLINWREFERHMGAALLPWLAAVIHKSASRHAETLPAVRKALPFFLTNQEAIAWAERWVGRLITGISDESRRAIRVIILGTLEGRYDPAEAARRIKLAIGLTERQAQAIENLRLQLEEQVRAEKITALQANTQLEAQRVRSLAQRAEAIARTESMTAANAGQQLLWEKGQREGYIPFHVKRILIVTPDEKLCIQCQSIARAGPVGLNEPFIDHAGIAHQQPPIHPSCFPGYTNVSASAPISAVSQRWYNGNLVVIHTATGKQLSCTPNHPVLTPDGWVPAGEVHEGGDVVCQFFGNGTGARNLQHEHMPASIHDIAKAFGSSEQVSATPVPVTAEDFHGDGGGSQVAVIWSDGLLGDRINGASEQQSSHVSLCRAHMELLALDSERAPESFIRGDSPLLSRLVRGGYLPASGEGVHSAPLEHFGFALAPENDTAFAEAVVNDTSGHAECSSESIDRFAIGVPSGDLVDRELVPFWRTTKPGNGVDASQPQSSINNIEGDIQIASNLLAGLSGAVHAEQVVKVERLSFSGHVYNLQTENHWYLAEGIIVHNCRCAMGLVYPNNAQAA